MTSAATTTEATASSRRWVLLGALCGVLCLVLPLTLGGWPGGQAQLVPPTRPGSSTSSTIDDTLGEHFKPMPASTVKARYAPDSAKDSSFRIDKEQLSVVVNRSTTPPEIVKVAALNADGKFDLPPEIQRVVFEIGTNDEPESIPVLQLNRDVAVIAFEPRPEAYAAMTSQFPKRLRSRLVAVPAAVAPGSGPKGSYTNMNVGGHKGCSSLLNMNQRLRRFASHEKKHAKRKAQAIQLRTVEWCTMSESVLEIPVVSLAAMVRFVPDSVQIPYVMTDAQGFDTMVISTLPTSFAKRVAFIVLECQDLPPQDHTLMLVDGALTCAEQQLCVESWFPHRLEYCWFNAYKVRELNCLYRNAGAPSEISAAPPRGLKISGAPLNISYPPRQASKWSCPVREEG